MQNTQQLIAEECDAIKAMLLAKNQAYGNSALEPLRVFSHAEPDEQIRVRIDDKLSRLSRGADASEDTVSDLIGYLILLRVSRRMHDPVAATARACLTCGGVGCPKCKGARAYHK